MQCGATPSADSSGALKAWDGRRSKRAVATGGGRRASTREATSPRPLGADSRRRVFHPSHGADGAAALPRCFFSRMTVYCYDCWPRDYPRWASLFHRHRIQLAFFSARQSADVFAARFPRMRAAWLPEATDPRVYASSKPLAERGPTCSSSAGDMRRFTPKSCTRWLLQALRIVMRS